MFSFYRLLWSERDKKWQPLPDVMDPDIHDERKNRNEHTNNVESSKFP